MQHILRRILSQAQAAALPKCYRRPKRKRYAARRRELRDSAASQKQMSRGGLEGLYYNGFKEEGLIRIIMRCFIQNYIRQHLFKTLPENEIKIIDGVIVNGFEHEIAPAQTLAQPPCAEIETETVSRPDQIICKDGRVILRNDIIRCDNQFGGWWHTIANLTVFTPRSNILAIQRGEEMMRITEPTETQNEAELNELASYSALEPTEYHLTPDDTPLEVIVEQYTASAPMESPAPQAESVAPAHVAPPLPAPRKTALTPNEAELFLATAKRLCTERERDGIWMGLLLHGISVSAIATLKLIGKTHVEETNGKRHKIPAWLHNTMNLVDPNNWRRSRNIIHIELRKYEVTPTLLTTAAHGKHGTTITLATS